MAHIKTVERLREIYAQPKGRSVTKQLDHLERHCRTFIAHAPFLVMGSQGADGLVDASPRGEAPGFVHVLDDHTIAIPDRPGNNRLDSLTNIIANPAVGLIFLIPGVDETLRINGHAEIHDDDALLERFAVNGKRPHAVILVRVAEAYLHCAKALMRARLWAPEARVERAALPTMSEMIRDQTGGTDAVESEQEMRVRYQSKLYCTAERGNSSETRDQDRHRRCPRVSVSVGHQWSGACSRGGGFRAGQSG